MTLLCKKIIVGKSKEVKIGLNVAETYEESYDSKICFVNDDHYDDSVYVYYWLYIQ
jgi:hypothetical protein